jgi:pimeloyl-ACP methyl ester carboxylesterase
MSENGIVSRELEVLGTRTRLYEGGAGTAVLLVHGGWAGAALSWSRVWGQLARRHRVVAPELPGLGLPEVLPRASVQQYAVWLVALLDVLGIERAACVGNSFGASVACSLAGRAPERCSGLVLVNGFAMPRTPLLLLWLGRTRLGAALMRAILRRVSFNPKALERAFVDAGKAPPALRDVIARPDSFLLSRFADILVAGDGPPPPAMPPLILWGRGDRLPGTGEADARRMHASLPGSTLRLVAGAGHFPQIEAPEAFLEHLEAFLEHRTG